MAGARPCPPAAVANSANIMQERKQFCETRPIIASSVDSASDIALGFRMITY